MIENITTTTREITKTIALCTAFDGTKFDTKKEYAIYEFKKSRYSGIGNMRRIIQRNNRKEV